MRLSNNEDVPADMVLLASSDPEALYYGGTAKHSCLIVLVLRSVLPLRVAPDRLGSWCG